MKCACRISLAALAVVLLPAHAFSQWVSAGRLLAPRADHTATLLSDGKVLVTGGHNGGPLAVSERFDPASASWAPTGALNVARSQHAAVLLPNRKVLAVGGLGVPGTALGSVELYDPAAGTWSLGPDGLTTPRYAATATLLRTGEVLVVGGRGAAGEVLASAEIFTPATGLWRPAGTMGALRVQHTASLLLDGRVLVSGGRENAIFLPVASREIYDPTSNTWSPAADFLPDTVGTPARHGNHSATLLPDGRVLFAGKSPFFADGAASAEIFDPVPGVSVPTGSMVQSAVLDQTATLLTDGRVLVTGGTERELEPLGASKAQVEFFDPAANGGTGAWSLGPPLAHQRTRHTATLLFDGRVLVAGGIDPRAGPFTTLVPGTPVAAAEMLDPRDPPMLTISSVLPDEPLPTGQVPPVLLPDGRVLYGGAILDLQTELWSVTGSPVDIFHTATLLPDGRVLATGSLDSNPRLYDPATGVWTPTGFLAPRGFNSATLLPTGRVLITGGLGAAATNAADFFDPATGLWSSVNPMGTARGGHTATLLPNGTVLVAGGALNFPGTNTLASAEIFDPATGLWRTAGVMGSPRRGHTATLLPNGKVLMAGGESEAGALATAELYDPVTGAWSATGPMNWAHRQHTATHLLDGRVLILGGRDTRDDVFQLSEMYDPASGRFQTVMPFLLKAEHAALLVPDGRVLSLGGANPFFGPTAQVLLDLGLPPLSRRPVITSGFPALAFGVPVTIAGTGFEGVSEASDGRSSQSAVNFPLVQLRALDNGQTTWLVPDARAAFDAGPLTISNLPASLNPGFHMVTVFREGLPSRPDPQNTAPLAGLTCSVAIRDQPVGQTIPLGTSATFTVSAQGARTYQWRRDGLPIPGATSASYTTPPLVGADSGSIYDVVVSGPCASATSNPAVLTAADAVPPQAAVVEPSGGEYWLLSPAAGPHRTEDVAWSMSDNVRICQVRVSLHYSNDGGVSYAEAPAGGGLPRVFGDGGSCAFPGVAATHLSYTVPTTYPSGRSGSLYRVQVEVSDQVGQLTVAQSENPFYILQSNPDVRTLVLSHTSRMQTILGLSPAQAAALDTKLRDLSTHARVQGVVVDLGQVSALAPRYAALDAAVAAGSGESVDAANDLLFGADGVHDQILSLLRAFPGVRYVVLVGDDRIIPMARMPDGTVLFDEGNYPAGGDLSATATAVGQALAARRFLSDDPLGLATPVRPADLSTSLFLPDLAVGRLVETPEEITTTIATFIGQDGVLDLSALHPTTGRKVLVTGYDFLQDSAALIRDRWKAVFGAAGSPDQAASPVDGSLVGGNWGLGSPEARRAALLGRLCGNGGARYGIASLSGHANHYLEGVPADGGSFTDIQGLASSAVLDPNACGAGRGVDLAGGVVYAVGCHGGLPVPGSDAADVNRSLDLPQSFLGRGVVAYVANSGYGWGPKFGPGYSKRLMEILTERLAVPGTIVTGDAVRRAKLQYFDQTGSRDAYDAKSLMQWTFFGLPMYAVETGIAAAGAPANPFADEAPAKSREARPALENVGGVTIQRQAENTLAAASLPPALTQLDLRFDFTAPGVYQKRGASGALLTTAGCADPLGCYSTLNGLATGKTDLPVEPYFVYDSRLSGTSQHGVLWKGGRYDQESGWKPVFTELTSNGGDGSDRGVAPREIGIQPIAIRRVPGGDPASCASSDQEVNTLVVTTGEVLTNQPTDAPYSTQRLFRDVNLEVLYFNNTSDPTQNCDRSGPVLAAGPLPGGLYHRASGTLVEWEVPAADAAGVWRVLVVVNDNSLDAQGRGLWTPLELADDGTGTWRGGYTASGPGVVTYMIQAVDNRGNVSWLDFVATPALAPKAAAPGIPGPGGLPASGVPLDIPWPVDVTIVGDGDTSAHVDAFSPTSGLVGASVSIFGRNLGATSAVAFNGTSAQFVQISPSNLMAVVPNGATTGPISVNTPQGNATSAASFTVVPGLSVGDVTVTRPAAGAKDAVFTVTLEPHATQTVTVQYATLDGTAVAGLDYTPTTGLLTFSPGTGAQTVAVPVLGNGTSGPPRTFALQLSNPSFAGLRRARGEATLLRPWRVSDWNTDGAADLVWQHESSGELAVWLLDRARRVGVLSLTPENVPDAQQRVVGTGDVDGDGQTDLVLQHTLTGAVTFWLMDGRVRTNPVELTPVRSARWRVVGVADWDQDGGADLLWLDVLTRALEVWILNGTSLESSTPLAPSRTSVWQVVSTADWNSDGQPDVLWYHRSTGQLEVWFMNGTTRVATSPLTPTKPANHELVAAVADFTGDGRPDLLLHHEKTGELVVWAMNGTTRTGTVVMSGVNYPGEEATTPARVKHDTRWQILAPR